MSEDSTGTKIKCAWCQRLPEEPFTEGMNKCRRCGTSFLLQKGRLSHIRNTKMTRKHTDVLRRQLGLEDE